MQLAGLLEASSGLKVNVVPQPHRPKAFEARVCTVHGEPARPTRPIYIHH